MAIVSALWVTSCGSAPTDHVPVLVPTVVATVPHDPAAYSEGLEFDGPALFESTGEASKSQLRQVDPDTGQVIRSANLPSAYFGEGITVVGERIWQLTYQDGVAIEWDKATLTPLREVPVAGESWGLCADGDRLIRSDGSGTLYFHDIDSWAQTGSVVVTRDEQNVVGLNELECVDGQVWAARWPDDEFVRVDPETGVVNAVLDVSGLWRFGVRDSRQVISGIAHVDGDEYLITGKEWPQSFRVRIPAG